MIVQNHYRNLLAKIYTWMLGDLEMMSKTQISLFESLKIAPSENRIAIDLGAGSGIQSIALSRMGFQVTAVDTSAELLDELKCYCPEVAILNQDIRELNFLNGIKPELIVCMGDTITHLDAISDVENLFIKVHNYLSDKGRFVLSFRDLSRPIDDNEKFILVKSDDQRILTCYLEDAVDKVKVFDLVHERFESSNWKLMKSYYYKLKLKSEQIERMLLDIGFKSVRINTLPSGLTIVLGLKCIP